MLMLLSDIRCFNPFAWLFVLSYIQSIGSFCDFQRLLTMNLGYLSYQVNAFDETKFQFDRLIESSWSRFALFGGFRSSS